jgi:hypothetical protein
MSVQIEATLDAIVGKLEAGLNTKIDEINAAQPDAYVLTYPVMIVTGARAERQYPCVMVLPGSTVNTVDTGGTILWNHQIIVSSWLQNFQEEALARQLMRFQRAVREVILKTRHPGTTAGGYGLQHTRDEYGPLFRPEPGGYFIQPCESAFMVQQQQDIN